jgi:hypothetical protein
MNEEHPEVAVAPFGDGSETPGGTCGGLAGREAEIGSEATAGGEPADVTDGGDESGGREDADARDGHEEGDRRDPGCEALELAPEVVGLGLELLDLKESLGKCDPEICGERLVIESEVGLGQEGAGALGDGKAELAQETADGIDACRACGEVAGPKTMQGGDGLLVDGFDGDGSDLLVASGFEEGFGIGTVGLVALAIPGHVSGRKQRHLMAEGLELAPPVMGRAASLHQDVGRGTM